MSCHCILNQNENNFFATYHAHKTELAFKLLNENLNWNSKCITMCLSHTKLPSYSVTFIEIPIQTTQFNCRQRFDYKKKKYMKSWKIYWANFLSNLRWPKVQWLKLADYKLFSISLTNEKLCFSSELFRSS